MTREEAIDLLDNLIGMVEDNHNSDYDKALKMAIEALKKEPCDAISRKEAIKNIRKQFSYGECYCDEYSIVGLMNNLPPVIPNLKIGHWIDGNENEIDARYGKHIYRCSECDKYADKFVAGSECWWDAEKPNYCPNCGAKMESEDKNEQKAKEKA